MTNLSKPDSPKPLGKKRALLISIRHVHRGYSFGLANLEFAHRDAEKLRDTLIASRGYQEDDIILMMDHATYPKHLWPTQGRILRQIDQLISDAPENCHFFFYFSGCGTKIKIESVERARTRPRGEEAAIICADGKLIPAYLLHDRLITPLERLKGSKLFALFDCSNSEALLDLQTRGTRPTRYSRVWRIGPGRFFKDLATVIVNLLKISSKCRGKRNNVPPAPRQASSKLRSSPTYETREVGRLDVIRLSACRDGGTASDDRELGLTFTKCFLNVMAAKPNITWIELRGAIKWLTREIQVRYNEAYPQDSGSESDGTQESLMEVPSRCATLFDYNEPSSPASSAHLCGAEAPSLDLSCAESRLSAPPLTTMPPEAPSPKKPGASEYISALKKHFVTRFKRTNRNQALQLPDQPSTQSSQPANSGSTSQSQQKVNITNEGPSRMAARSRLVYTPVPPKAEKQQGEQGGDRDWVTIKVPAWIGRLLRLLKVRRRTIPGD